jgi:HlyD family secretion protein
VRIRFGHLIRLLGMLLIAGLVAWGFWPQPVVVDIATAARGEFQVTVNEEGRTRVRERYVVSAPVPGHLLRIELREGDSVEQGKTPLASIEPAVPTLLDARTSAEAEAKVRIAQAAVERAESAKQRAVEARELADHFFKRIERLTTMNNAAKEQFDAAEHALRITEADVRSAEFGKQVARFELELAQAALLRAKPADGRPVEGPLKITSPINGRVLRVLHESAGVVQSGAQLIELGDPTDLEMEIDILSQDAVRVERGAKVLVEHWGGPTTLNGVVRVVEPSAFLKISALGVEEQRVNVIADFLEPLEARRTLGDGYRIEVRIVARRAANVLKVPSGAVFHRGDVWAVYRSVNSRAHECRVEIGDQTEIETEILSGLEPGDIVIVYPSDRVRDGATVRHRR